jgi:hypothetical protein
MDEIPTAPSLPSIGGQSGHTSPTSFRGAAFGAAPRGGGRAPRRLFMAVNRKRGNRQCAGPPATASIEALKAAALYATHGRPSGGPRAARGTVSKFSGVAPPLAHSLLSAAPVTLSMRPSALASSPRRSASTIALAATKLPLAAIVASRNRKGTPDGNPKMVLEIHRTAV